MTPAARAGRARAGFAGEDLRRGIASRCGSAGTYSILPQPGASPSSRDRAAGIVRDPGRRIVATGNIGCITHLASGAFTWIDPHRRAARLGDRGTASGDELSSSCPRGGRDGLAITGVVMYRLRPHLERKPDGRAGSARCGGGVAGREYVTPAEVERVDPHRDWSERTVKTMGCCRARRWQARHPTRRYLYRPAVSREDYVGGAPPAGGSLFGGRAAPRLCPARG